MTSKHATPSVGGSRKDKPSYIVSWAIIGVLLNAYGKMSDTIMDRRSSIFISPPKICIKSFFFLLVLLDR